MGRLDPRYHFICSSSLPVNLVVVLSLTPSHEWEMSFRNLNLLSSRGRKELDKEWRWREENRRFTYTVI